MKTLFALGLLVLSTGGFAAVNPPAATSDPDEFQSWPEYQRQDFKQLAARLRAEKYPAKFVRDIVVDAIQEQFQARRWELFFVPNYWINQERFQERRRQDPENESLALSRREQQLTSEALGADLNPPDEKDAAAWHRWTAGGLSPDRVEQIGARIAARRKARGIAYELRYKCHRYGELSAEKISRLERINSDYDQLRTEIGKGEANESRSVTVQKVLLAERERRADLQRLLTAAELLQYDLRTSQSSHDLRSRLRWLDATEKEFRALFTIQQAFDLRYPEFWAMVATREQLGENEKARAALEEQFHAALGDARYDQWKRQTQEGDAVVRAAMLASRPKPPPLAPGARLTLSLFSGRRNPVVPLSPAQFAQVKELMASLPDGPAPKEGEPDRFPFGRSLFSAVNVSSDSSYDALRVAETAIELRHFTPEQGPGSTAIFKRDDTRRIENELIRLTEESASLEPDIKRILSERLAARETRKK